ncbi:MAG: LysR family transcriptional regulator [Clostridia bacterium]
MNIDKYEVFVRVADIGSITGAAKQMGYTQSGVSHVVNALEDEFGFQLLIRKKAGVTLTPEGERMARCMREVIGHNEQLMQEASSIHGLRTGQVRIGTFSSVAVHWLPKIITGFKQRFPLIGLTLMDGVYQDIEDWIAQEQIDCGFITKSTHKELDYVPLAQDRMLAILPQGHPLANSAFLPFAAIADEQLIIPGEGSNYDIGRILRQAGVSPSIRFAISDDYAAIAMVEQGLGISILPELVLEGQVYRVRAIELEGGCCRTIGIAVRSEKNASPACREFIAYVKAWVRDNVSI